RRHAPLPGRVRLRVHRLRRPRHLAAPGPRCSSRRGARGALRPFRPRPSTAVTANSSARSYGQHPRIPKESVMTGVLEPAAQAFAEATAQPPLLYELGVDGARKLLDDVQAAPIDLPDVNENWITVAAPVGDVRVR